MKIRGAVFETNSSSTHSLVLSQDLSGMVKEPFPINIVSAGVVTVFPNEYGWEQESYYDVYSKLSYLYVDAMRGEDGSVDPNSPEYRETNEKLMKIATAVKLYSGIDVIFEKSSDRWYPFGYIDHQSVGLCDEVFSQDIEGVAQFIFNNNSYFETDNDNH